MLSQFKGKPLVVLTGPTAVGKTGLSIKLAKEIGGEIVSADSVQVYKRLNIGSAKITKEEMQGVPHHLIDVLDPDEEFNVVLFQKMCCEALQKIYENGHIPILTGGTGFYIQAVLKNVDFTENDEDTTFRDAMEVFAKEHGEHALHEKLRQVDPLSAEQIHENNIRRVIRALEFYEKTGTPISEHNEKEGEKSSIFNSCYFVLTDHRDVLYRRIDERVDIMVSNGLVEEVQGLMEEGLRPELPAMQAIGYREILDYLKGTGTLDEAIDRVKTESRHYAKRQLTWFKREKEVIWIPKYEFQSEEAILDFCIRTLSQRNIYKEK